MIYFLIYSYLLFTYFIPFSELSYFQKEDKIRFTGNLFQVAKAFFASDHAHFYKPAVGTKIVGTEYLPN